MNKIINLIKIITIYFKKLLKLIVVKIDRESVANTYIKGKGIEIGALHNPLKVSKNAKVKYVDRMSVAELRKHYPELRKGNLVDVNIIDDGETLSRIEDKSQDFVIVNHFVEHTQNPISAIQNMARILKQNGIIYIALPDKRFTFDVARKVTPLIHLQRDYHEGPEWSYMEHLDDWANNVRIGAGDIVSADKQKLIDMNYSIHYHVWEQKDMIELFLYIQTIMPLEIELMLRHNDENIFILRKLSNHSVDKDSSTN